MSGVINSPPPAIINSLLAGHNENKDKKIILPETDFVNEDNLCPVLIWQLQYLFRKCLSRTSRRRCGQQARAPPEPHLGVPQGRRSGPARDGRGR